MARKASKVTAKVAVTTIETKATNTKKDDAAKASSAEIITMIGTISDNAKSIQVLIHQAMSKIVVHAIKFGDVRLADRLISALGERNKTVFRANTMRDWFEKMGPFRYDTEAKNFKLNTAKRDLLAKKVTNAKNTAKFYTELMKVAPWEAKPEPEYKGLDFLKLIKGAIRQADKAQKNHANHPKTKLEGLNEVRSFIANLNVGDTEKGTDTNDNKIIKDAA
jgi:hypothetical protein